jgi:hypothetical protein
MERAGRSVIIHANGESPLKGRERANHKYLAREWKNGKWRYTYNKTSTSKGSGANGYNTTYKISGSIDTSNAGKEYVPRRQETPEEYYQRYLEAEKRNRERRKQEKKKRRKERINKIKSSIERGMKKVKKMLGMGTYVTYADGTTKYLD